MCSTKFFLPLALALALVTPLAHATKADREQPIQISADRGSLDQIKGITQWDGAVVVIQGTLILHADHATVSRDAKGNQVMVATGRIVTFRQMTDDVDSERKPVWVEGQASRVDYNTATNTAILTTNARVKKGGDLLIGNVIIYHTDTQVYQSEGGPTGTSNNGRVTAILQPQKQKASDSTGKQP